jgi:membrane protease YdiL (CAAX protease family)
MNMTTDALTQHAIQVSVHRTQTEPMQQFSEEKIMVHGKAIPEIPQYSLRKILLIWVAAAAPMGVLGWIIAPALSRGSANPGTVRVAALTLGLIWQFALVLILLAHEGSSWRWSDIRQRLWLRQPSSEKGGRTDRRLWWWLIPVVVLTVLYEMQVIGVVDRLWVSLFPALAEPPGFSLGAILGSPEAKAQMVGAWGFYWLFMVNALFNTVIGEELLFRGLLLPRMARTFGKWDWVGNGLLFGFYHWHQPWVFMGAAIEGAFLFAFPTRRFKSAWFGVIAHSGQTVFFAFLLLGLVLGLA